MWSDVQGGAVDAGRVRGFVRRSLTRHGVGGEVVDDAVLGASELATNAIRHAGGLLRVRTGVRDDTVRVEVEDGSTELAVRLHPDPLDTSGRGLVIVDGLSSRWGIEGASDGGKVVWFELDRRRDPAELQDLAADLGERDRVEGPARRTIVVAAVAAVLGSVVANVTSDVTNSELLLALAETVLVLGATLLGGLPAGLAAGAGLVVGTIAFHEPTGDISKPLLALSVGLGALLVSFFTWAGLQLRARAKAEARLLERLQKLGEGLTAVDDEQDPVGEVERLAAETAGARQAEILTTMRRIPATTSGSAVAVLPLEGPQRFKTLVLRLDRSAGRIASDERDTFHRAIADMCAQALAGIELRAAEQRARADLEIMAEASRVLMGSLDVEKVTSSLRDVLVPRLLDELDIDLVVSDGDRDEASASERRGTAGESDVMTIDLRSRDRTIGRMTSVRREDRFDADDRNLLAELANRAAAALDNALLYAERATTSRILEQSLLPSAFIQLPNLDVGARYLASTAGHEVGGDFYDVLPTPEGDMVLIVGDVQGKGVEAATLTALARHTLRAAALAGEGPAGMLRRLNQALRWEQAERDDADDDPLMRFVTAAVAVLHPTPTGFRATVSRGGHPLPILVRPAGEIEQLKPHGTILGAFDDPGCTEVTIDLTLSDTLVLFTDGVVEHRQAADLFDELELGRLLRNQLIATGADDLAQLILDTVVSLSPTESRDDVAILVTRIIGPR